MSVDTTTGVTEENFEAFCHHFLQGTERKVSFAVLLAENQPPYCLEYFLDFELRILNTKQLRSVSVVEIIWM